MESKTLLSEFHLDHETSARFRHVKQTTEYFRPHSHDYFEVFLILGGKATHVVNDIEIPVSRGCLVFIRDFDTHDYKDCEDGFEFYNLAFSRDTLQSLCDYLCCHEKMQSLSGTKKPPNIWLSDTDTERLKMKFAQINTVRLDDKKSTVTKIRAILCEIFSKHLLTSSNEQNSMPFWLEIAIEKMRLPENFIQGAPKFYELCGKTREHCARELKKHKGVCVNEYINDLRLSYAANLLITSNLSTADICYECGFQNLSWFYTAFAKKYGTSPAKLRKK